MRFTPILLRVSRAMGGGHDAALDRYTYILERLREADFRRLRAFRPEGPAQFPTWLVVTARRLCLDHHRACYGRAPATGDGQAAERLFRRRLAQGDGLELPELVDPQAGSPEDALDEAARAGVLEEVLAGLEPRDRLILRLRFEDGLGAIEIAQLLHLPTPFHVYRRVRMLLGILRAPLARHPLFRRRE